MIYFNFWPWIYIGETYSLGLVDILCYSISIFQSVCSASTRPITSCLNTLHGAHRLVLHTATHVWPIHSSHFLDRKVITLPLVNFVVCESSSSLEKIFRGEYLTSFNSDPAATKLSSSSYTLAYYFCISLPKSCPISVTYNIILHTIMYQIS